MMSRNSFYFCIFTLIPILLFFYNPISVGDLSIWVKLGIDSIDQAHVISLDTYTLSETIPMVYPVFLSLVYGLLFKLNGIELVAVAHALIPAVWLFYWLRFLKQQKTSESKILNFWDAKTITLFVISFLGLSIIYLPRPALVSTIPFIISFYLLSIRKNMEFRLKDLLSLVFLEILWVNVHGSFLILPLMIIWQIPFLLLQKKMKLLLNRFLSFVLVILSILINPFTFRVIPYTWETAIISKARNLNEWFPTHNFDYPFTSSYFYTISGLLLAILIFKVRTKEKALAVFSNPFFLLWISGFFALRNTFFIFLVLPIFIFDELVNRNAKPFTSKRYSEAVNACIIFVIAVAVALMSPFFKRHIKDYLPEKYSSTFNQDYRVEKINQFLSTHEGPIFNSWEYGSDLALVQNNKYFIDTRNIIFSDRVDHEYDLFLKQPTSDFVSKYQFKYLLLHKPKPGLLSWIKLQSDYSLVIEEGPAMLFEKQNNF